MHRSEHYCKKWCNYQDLTLHPVPLNELDFSLNASPLKMVLASKSNIIDNTNQFKNGKSNVY